MPRLIVPSDEHLRGIEESPLQVAGGVMGLGLLLVVQLEILTVLRSPHPISVVRQHLPSVSRYPGEILRVGFRRHPGSLPHNGQAREEQWVGRLRLLRFARHP